MTNTLPEAFWNRVKEIYSAEDIESIKKGFAVEYRKPSFRVNTLKGNEDVIIQIIKDAGLDIKAVDYLENCYTLESGREKDLWELDVYKDGKIYMQQISSQIPVNFFHFKEGDKVLDLTAAPGSKTSQIAAKLNKTGEIFANDNNAIRIEKLEYTLKKQGVKNVQITKSDARNIAEPIAEILVKQGGVDSDILGYFDKILLDAPCSAEGRINMNKEKSFGFWKEDIFKRHYRLSKQILETAIPLLARGGELIFSTCTIAPEENEALTHFILSNYPELSIEEISLDNQNMRPGIKAFGKQIYRTDVTKTLRCLPSEDTEGFYIAKFKKNLD